MNIKNNTTSLQALLEQAQSLPDAITLDTLSNEGTSADLLAGKELLDSEGKKVTGTIPTKTASNLTTSGATVTVPAGYYSAQATKSVATATQATPSVNIDSAGKITATSTQSAGYVSAGTKTGTKQLTTQAAKTITPTKSSQTAVASGVYTTGAVTVAAIPSQYEDITASLADLNAANGGTAATTISVAVDNTEALANSQESLITQIAAALEGKVAGGGSAEPVLQSKTVSPTTSSQTVKPDSGYDGLSQVTVNAMTTATQATPTIEISTGGLITASSTQSAGYVSAGTKSVTKQLSTQAAKTITPSTSSQTAVASGKYTTGAVTVAAIPSNYEDLTAETTTYTGLISDLRAAVNALPDAGSGGGSGGSVETCTVEIDITGAGGLSGYAHTTVDANGDVVYYDSGTIASQNTATISCVINTILYIKSAGGPGYPDLATATGCEVVGSFLSGASLFLRLTCAAGETATFKFVM